MTHIAIIWTAAIVTLLIAVTAFYLSSRHQKLMDVAPSRNVLRGVQLLCTAIAFALFCCILALATAIFALLLFAMLACTFLPLIIAALVPLKEGMR